MVLLLLSSPLEQLNQNQLPLKCQKQLLFNKCLVFGLDPRQLLLNLTPTLYAPFKINDLEVLWSWSLTDINQPQNKQHKKQLWTQLQQIFKLS